MIRSQNVITSTTWANKPSSYITGQPVFISNAGTKGSHWFYDGTRWKPMNGTALLASLDAATSAIDTNETIVLQYLVPAGLWQTGDRLRVYLSQAKSGTTDFGSVYVHIGTAGTVADATVVTRSNLPNATRQVSSIFDIRLESATTCLPLPSSRPQIGYGGTGSATAFDSTPVTITSAAANALYVSVSMNSGGATNTVQAIDCQIEIVSKAN